MLITMFLFDSQFCFKRLNSILNKQKNKKKLKTNSKRFKDSKISFFQYLQKEF